MSRGFKTFYFKAHARFFFSKRLKENRNSITWVMNTAQLSYPH